MRIVLACLLLLLNSAVSLGQERYFGENVYDATASIVVIDMRTGRKHLPVE